MLMKRCLEYRKFIAWQAADELDARRKNALEAHLDSCEACRRYQAEMLELTGMIRTANGDAGMQASESFHRKIMTAVSAERSRSVWDFAAAWQVVFRNWRIALPVIGVIVVLFAAMMLARRPGIPPAVAMDMPVIPSPVEQDDLDPTLVNYQMAAGLTLDQLNELLNKQADKSPPPAPIYTVSSFARTLASD